MSNEYVHMIANLVAVLAAIFILLFLMKKFKLTKIANNKHIKIINAVSLGTKEKIVLMEVNNVMLLIGATPNHIETLHVFSDKTPIMADKDFSETMAELTK